MKKLFASLFLGLLILNLATANAMTIDQQSIDILTSKGLQLRMGELTGAGSKVSLKGLVGLLLPDAILMKEDCSSIITKLSPDPKVSDILKVKVQGHEINASEFVGFITY